MIKFFRAIRQKLVQENKLKKYFLYAIGEIILVVIGILIALSINNKNEVNKERQEEAKILAAIESDFIETKIELEKTIKLQKDMIANSSDLIDIIATEDTSAGIDSISRCMDAAFAFWRAEPLTATYDALIGAGKTHLIQDKYLLKHLKLFHSKFEQGFEDDIDCRNLSNLMNESGGGYYLPFSMKLSKNRLNLKSSPTEEQLNLAVDHLMKNKAFATYLIKRTSLEKYRLEGQLLLLDLTKVILSLFEFEEIELNKKALQAYVGTYNIERFGIGFEIFLKNETLYIQVDEQSSFPIFPYEKDGFFLKDVFAQMKFHRENDKIIGGIHYQNDQEFEFKNLEVVKDDE